jgi:hypothetical protein
MMLLSRSCEWTAYQQTSFVLTGHSQRAELNSAANATEKKQYSQFAPFLLHMSKYVGNMFYTTSI